MTDLPGADLQAMWSSLLGQLDAHRERSGAASEAVVADGELVPVCLLTGFLGAGKSTLLARLLTDPPAAITVRAVVNDIGSLPFDPTLLAEAGKVEVELTNGCGCCERIDGLAETLDRVAAGRPDLLVLEASGVADPFGLAQVIEARPGLYLDRIVTVVDAAAIQRQLDHPGYRSIVGRQLDAAHCVVLSHADRLAPTELDRVTTVVAALVPGRIIASSCPDGPGIDVLCPTARRGARPMSELGSLAQGMVTHGLVTIQIEQSAVVSRSELAATLARRSPGAMRGKGYLMLDGAPHEVQFTVSTISIEPVDAEADAGWRMGRFSLVATSGGEVDELVELISRSGTPML